VFYYYSAPSQENLSKIYNLH